MTSAEKLTLSNARLVLEAMPVGHSRAAILRVIQVADRLIKWCDHEPTDGAVAPDRTLDDLLSAALRRVDWLEGELLHIERVARVQQTDPLVTNANLAAFRQIERLCRDAIDGKPHAQRSKP